MFFRYLWHGKIRDVAYGVPEFLRQPGKPLHHLGKAMWFPAMFPEGHSQDCRPKTNVILTCESLSTTNKLLVQLNPLPKPGRAPLPWASASLAWKSILEEVSEVGKKASNQKQLSPSPISNLVLKRADFAAGSRSFLPPKERGTVSS